ncbi:MAG: cytochrome c biogenesis protein ResB [Chloroflexi bacterium]|nr:cytochrome c biogenesis protein ResB [Chloroflexota bacterium]
MNFAVLQILILALLGVVGMTIRQLPSFAFRTPSDYANELNKLHALYDPVFGTGVVDWLERLQLFNVFGSPWFQGGLVLLVISIVICTIDRTPRLYRQATDIRVVQPDAYFDPRLPDRVRIAGSRSGPAGSPLTAADVRGALARHRFGVREAAGPDGTRYLYGDRNRWTKLATLVTHLGLVLFVLAAAITTLFGDEQGLIVAEGDTLTVQQIGTPGLLLVRNFGFDAPGFETGSPTDFTTDLAVYRDGQLLQRKTIRVNDPLTVGGYTFHQNGFGPAPELLIRDADGQALWSGPVPMTDSAAGLPFGTLPVPGRDIGLQLLLDRTAEGVGVLVVLPYRVVGEKPDGTPDVLFGGPLAIARGETQTGPELDFFITLNGFADYTLIIAKHDPGAGFIWSAFAFLILGLAITFYLPRRRVWARLAPDGELALVGRSDRYVDLDREFGALVDELAALRAAGRPG